MDMRGSSRFALLLATSLTVAACNSSSDPASSGTLGSTPAEATTSPTASTTSQPTTTTSAVPSASSTADDATGELRITTQSYVSCPQIGPSPKADCGFRPLPKVTIEIAARGTEPTTVRTGDDGTVDVPVRSGNVTVTGTAVAEYPWPPDPVEIEISPGQTGDVVLIYSDGPQIPPPPR